MDPAAVAREIRQREASDLTVQALEQTVWLEIVETPPAPSLIQAWDLGPGESSVLAYAYAKTGAVAVMDDLAGRRCAEALKIPVNGTLGLTLIAKQRGLIPAARPVLDTLRQAGMYLSDRVIDEARHRVRDHSLSRRRSYRERAACLVMAAVRSHSQSARPLGVDR